MAYKFASLTWAALAVGAGLVGFVGAAIAIVRWPQVVEQPAVAQDVVHEAPNDANPKSPKAPARQPEIRDESDSPAAAELWSDAIAAFDAHESIAAKVRLRIEILGKSIVGNGSYLQGERESKLLRYAFRILPDERSQAIALEQVCDGRSFWTRRQFPASPESISVIDLRKVDRETVRRQREQGIEDGDAPVAAPAEWPSTNLNLGGLRRLMDSLQTAFDWQGVERRKLGTTPVWVMRGAWRPGYLARLLPDQKAAIESGQPPDLSKLPPAAPDQAVVMLGVEDLFPYRVEYTRRRPSAKDGEATAGPRDDSLLVFEFYDVRFDVQIDKQQFAFDPGNGAVVDQTDQYLQALLGEIRR